MYETGDIVKVKNATNGIGVYQIISYHPHENTPYSGGHYKVYVLDIDRDSLPKLKTNPEWSVTPSRYLTMAKKNPELYKMARFRRYNTTTKLAYNVREQLPFTPDQVVA